MASIPVLLILFSTFVLGVVLLGILLFLIVRNRKKPIRLEMGTFYGPYVLPDSTPWRLGETSCVPIQPRIYEDLQRSEDEDTQEEILVNVSENVAGKLELSLQYDSQRSILLVTLHKAYGLQEEKQDDVTYYVTIKILPQIHRSFQSAAVTGKNPEFQELFEFCVPYESLLEQQLKFSVSQFDRFSRHDFTGDVMVHLAELEHRGLYLSREIHLIRTINAVKKTSGDLGELLFALAYLPLTERLNVDVMKAKDLPLGQEGQKPDPYVKVSLLDAGREVKWARTATLKNYIQDATYNDRLVFHVSMATLHQRSLLLCVMHDEQGRGEDKCLGKVFLGPEATGSQFEHWNEMRVNNKPIARWHKLFQ